MTVVQSCPTLCDPMDCSPCNSPNQNAGVGILCRLQGNLPNPGIEPRSPALQADFSPAEPQVLGLSTKSVVRLLLEPRVVALNRASLWVYKSGALCGWSTEASHDGLSPPWPSDHWLQFSRKIPLWFVPRGRGCWDLARPFTAQEAALQVFPPALQVFPPLLSQHLLTQHCPGCLWSWTRVGETAALGRAPL